MTNKEKRMLLSIAEKLVYECTEYTPPEVKSSELNYRVAKTVMEIQALSKYLKKGKPFLPIQHIQ